MDTQTTLGAGEIIRLPKSSKFNTFLAPESHRSEPNTKSFQDQKGNSLWKQSSPTWLSALLPFLPAWHPRTQLLNGTVNWPIWLYPNSHASQFCLYPVFKRSPQSLMILILSFWPFIFLPVRSQFPCSRLWILVLFKDLILVREAISSSRSLISSFRDIIWNDCCMLFSL